jgi:hypothetical protein
MRGGGTAARRGRGTRPGPQARVELHGLVERVAHAQVLAVLEHSDRGVVHEEPASTQ